MGAWVLAGFSEEERLANAARGMRRAGFERVEAYTPYQSEAVMESLPGSTQVATVVLLAGFVGIGTGLLIQWWCNAFNFPINVGGRPPLSLPTYLPICFECMVLFGSLSGLYAFFISCRLPKLDHALQRSELFARHTVDRFVLAVRWESASSSRPLEKRLRELGASEIEEVGDS
ncbi:MAG: DUF3341 domain-containing protein [Deltaproteobacteria bacterium]|nr:DUF3341 domain-containing protein [Deltaproteobacteria bacterium]